MFKVLAFAAIAATITPGTQDLYSGTKKLSTHSDLPACVAAAKARGVSANYTCRTRTAVVVAVTVDPPPVPPDPTPTPTPDPVPPSTSAKFTDLASAPACAKVTVYPAKTVTDAAGAGIPTHVGRCLEYTPATFTAAAWAAVQPGDVVYLHAGTYTGRWGEGTWYHANGETYKKGTAAQPIALVAYPGEAVTLDGRSAGRPPIVFGSGSAQAADHAEYITVAGMTLIGSAACLSGGGDSTIPAGGPDETGGRYIRIVGVNCTITDATTNTFTGLIDLGNDGWKLLGNEFHDPANRTVWNNNHVVYIQGGADDVEVAYNRFVGLHTGHVVQIHQDGTPKLYERIWLHDNLFRATNYGDMRGISFVNVADGSTLLIERDHLEHVGWDDWGCLNTYGGIATAIGLECVDTHWGVLVHGQAAGDHYGGAQRQVILKDSKICPSSGQRLSTVSGAPASSITETNAKACP
jgi:hypothetical protein